jgi:hypothetical protein
MNKLSPAPTPDQKAPPRYRAPGRPGIEQSEVDRAADELLTAGERPSVEKIRARVGGSPNTIAPLLDAWWARLAGRIAAGPDALARLPEPVALAAEALFIRALDAARTRAENEISSAKEALTHDQQLIEARRHVLSLREAELERRLAERDQVVSVLKETLRYERGQRRKLELANESLQVRLRALEAKGKPRPATTYSRKSSSPTKPRRARAPAKFTHRRRSR